MAPGASKAFAWTPPTPAGAKAGRAALERWVDRHGGRNRWSDLPPLTCEVTLGWAATARMLLPNTPETGPRTRFSVHFEADKARLDFGDSRESCWGFDSREAWTSEGGLRTYGQVAQVDRFVRAIAWYASMPHKLLDPAVQHVLVNGDSDAHIGIGFGTEGGRTGDRMQALFEAGRLVLLRHTARDLGAEIQAAARFLRWQEVQGVWVPAEVRVSLEAPVAIQDAQVLGFQDWRPFEASSTGFEKPTSDLR